MSGAIYTRWALLVLAMSFNAACISPCDGRLNTDMDGDGLPDATDRDKDGDGWRPVQGDCDDCDPEIGPNYVDDTRDGVDQDCDGVDGG